MDVQLHFLASRTFEERLRRAEQRSGRRRSDILRDGALREIESIERTTRQGVVLPDRPAEEPLEIVIELPPEVHAAIDAPTLTEPEPNASGMGVAEKVALVVGGAAVGAVLTAGAMAVKRDEARPQPTRSLLDLDFQ